MAELEKDQMLDGEMAKDEIIVDELDIKPAVAILYDARRC